MRDGNGAMAVRMAQGRRSQKRLLEEKREDVEIVRGGDLLKRSQDSCPVPSQRDWLDGGAANEESKKERDFSGKSTVKMWTC